MTTSVPDSEPVGKTFDYVVIGSGFGGSVSAMRLTEKGYSVLVLERGKRYRDQDFARTNWQVHKYLWAPALRCFGILQISPFKDVFVLHGSGVGGGSLGYATVLMSPDEEAFASSAWQRPFAWKPVLQPHYATARRMLGVAHNPRQWDADRLLHSIAGELGTQDSFQATDVGIFFGKPGEEGKQVPDPFFNGEGPARNGCIHCGGCMVGCRHNAKNTLVKNYLYLAEKRGAQVWPESEVRDIVPLPPDQPDGARYEIVYRSSTNWFMKPEKRLRARNVVVSAGALGTMRLLFRCREITGSLSRLSPRLGDFVRTNNESLLGVTSRTPDTDYSKGIAITSIFHADDVTTVEPVRYPAGSSLMRFLSGPLLEQGGRSVPARLGQTLMQIVTRPRDFARTHILPGWAERSTILLVMQTEDNSLKLRLGRSPWTLFKRNLVSIADDENRIPSKIDIGHWITRRFAEQTNGIPAGSFNEGLFNIPLTAHILGGVPFGNDAEEGVIGLDCQVHNYPGLYVIDGSIIPANPGVNPSLSITAMAEYAMNCVPPKKDARHSPQFGARPEQVES